MSNKYSGFIRSKDFICGVLIVVFSFIVYLQTINGKYDVILFPRIVAFLSFFMGMATILLSFKNNNNKPKKKAYYYLMELGFCTFMLLIISIVNVLGFYTSIFLICCGSYGMIKYLAGERVMKSTINILLFSFLATF